MTEQKTMQTMRTARVGRPTKYSAEAVERLCTALEIGMPIKGACVVAGVGVATLGEWRTKFPDLESRLSEAREMARQKALQAIKAAGDRDWRAWAEWLKLGFPADYRGRTRIDVSATASASSAVVLSEEQQRDLREQRRRIMTEETPTGGTEKND